MRTIEIIVREQNEKRVHTNSRHVSGIELESMKDAKGFIWNIVTELNDDLNDVVEEEKKVHSEEG